MSVPHTHVFANNLLFDESTGDYAGFDEEEPTSRSGGKTQVVELLLVRDMNCDVLSIFFLLVHVLITATFIHCVFAHVQANHGQKCVVMVKRRDYRYKRSVIASSSDS